MTEKPCSRCGRVLVPISEPKKDNKRPHVTAEVQKMHCPSCGEIAYSWVNVGLQE